MLLIVLVLSVAALTVAFVNEGFTPLSGKLYTLFPATAETETGSFSDFFKVNDETRTPVLISGGEIGVVNGKMSSEMSSEKM
jgi:hypothetical protein